MPLRQSMPRAAECGLPSVAPSAIPGYHKRALRMILSGLQAMSVSFLSMLLG